MSYVNPDDLLSDYSSIVFVYGDINGKREFIAKEYDIHAEILEPYYPHIPHPPFDADRNILKDDDGNIVSRRAEAMKTALVGRIGEYQGKYYLSLWNNDQGLINRLMPDLIRELKKRKYPY
jgi:hypothetical protein